MHAVPVPAVELLLICCPTSGGFLNSTCTRRPVSMRGLNRTGNVTSTLRAVVYAERDRRRPSVEIFVVSPD